MSRPLLWGIENWAQTWKSCELEDPPWVNYTVVASLVVLHLQRLLVVFMLETCLEAWSEELTLWRVLWWYDHPKDSRTGAGKSRIKHKSRWSTCRLAGCFSLKDKISTKHRDYGIDDYASQRDKKQREEASYPFSLYSQQSKSKTQPKELMKQCRQNRMLWARERSEWSKTYSLMEFHLPLKRSKCSDPNSQVISAFDVVRIWLSQCKHWDKANLLLLRWPGFDFSIGQESVQLPENALSSPVPHAWENSFKQPDRFAESRRSASLCGTTNNERAEFISCPSCSHLSSSSSCRSNNLLRTLSSLIVLKQPLFFASSLSSKTWTRELQRVCWSG